MRKLHRFSKNVYGIGIIGDVIHDVVFEIKTTADCVGMSFDKIIWFREPTFELMQASKHCLK